MNQIHNQHLVIAEVVADRTMHFVKTSQTTGQTRMLGYITDTVDVQIPHQCACKCMRTPGCRLVLSKIQVSKVNSPAFI